VIGEWPEHAVDTSEVEPETGQALLKPEDIVARDEVPRSVGQHAVTERPSGLFEATESLHSDDSVDRETARLLKGTHRAVDGVVETR